MYIERTVAILPLNVGVLLPKLISYFNIFVSGVTPYKSALSPGCSTMSYLDDCYNWISSWRIKTFAGKDVTTSFKFVDGWLMNIRSLQQLVQEMCQGPDLTFLCTRRCCSDPLENFFSVIRGRRGFEQNPSCLGFSQSFKQAICS